MPSRGSCDGLHQRSAHGHGALAKAKVVTVKVIRARRRREGHLEQKADDDRVEVTAQLSRTASPKTCESVETSGCGGGPGYIHNLHATQCHDAKC